MKQLLLLLTLFTLYFFCPKAFGQEWQWVKQAGSNGYDRADGIGVDAAGNSYVTGWFDDTISFGHLQLINKEIDQSNAHYNIFLTKYGANGQEVWTRQAGGLYSDVGRAIAVDAVGNSYIIGNIQNDVSFGGITLKDNGVGNVFIAKYNSDGQVLWAVSPNSVFSEAFDVAIDAQGNSYIAGWFRERIVFGSTILTDPEKKAKPFLAKYNPQGQPMWAKTIESTGYGVAYGLTVDAQGNCQLAGNFSGTIAFESVQLQAKGRSDVFLVKYDSEGNVVWVNQGISGNLNFAVGTALALDKAGNSYLTGNFIDEIAFGDRVLSGSGQEDIFLVKYDVTGNIDWAMKYGGKGADIGKGIAVDATNQIYLTGTFSQIVEMGTTTLTSIAEEDFFLAQYDSQGQPSWAKRAGGLGTDGLDLDLALDNQGNSYIAGDFGGTITFGSTEFTAVSADVFVTKVSASARTNPTLVLSSLPKNSYCAGSSVAISFTTSGSFSVNAFSVQLSDASGSFASPVTIGTGSTSPIMATIPSTTSTGSSYRMRVIAASPSLTSEDNEVDLNISVPPSVPVITSVARCDPGSVTLRATGASGNQSYHWYTTASGDSPIPLETTATFITPVLSSTTTYYVSVANEGGCESLRTPVTVTINKSPEVNAGPDESICTDRASFTLSGFSPLGGVWSGSGVTPGGSFNPQAAGFGTHILTYTVIHGVCTVSKNKTVIVEPFIEVSAGSELTVCSNSPAFKLTDVAPTGGVWSGPGVTTEGLFQPIKAGIGSHTLIYSIQKGECQSSATKSITVTASPVINASILPTECSTASTTQAFAPFKATFTNQTQGATNFLWDFGDGYTSNEAVPNHTYTQEGRFKVTLVVYYGNECNQTKVITEVVVLKKQELPNVFTPNRDGLNDTFAPNITCLSVNLKIFDRYGKLVFEQANYQNTWDGGNLPDGVYYYQLTTAKGASWKGWVELIR